RVGIMYGGRIVEIGQAEELFHRPKHPYSQGLMASFPTIAMMRMAAGGERPKLRGISGSAPNPREIPKGCAFHPRCPYTTEICLSQKPLMTNCGNDHLVACHQFSDVDSLLKTQSVNEIKAQ
ncbi:MAG: hypothetical protein P1Q69_20385, partial [Candidatus Thorarchaeota archaeon]|nr:hypothetical protein [Candidatus Thorarchaeota archaeon]